jgi:hypothetical protein
MVPLINDEYTLPLPPIIPILVEESTKASEVSKAPIIRTVKPKKLTKGIQELTKEL